MKEYQIKAPAKINIGLRILGRRNDGYHEIISIMVPISLFDTLYLSSAEKSGIILDCRGRGNIPADERNLAYRAAQSFQEKTGIREGLYIQLIKNIPVAAGLGGGSSDAAAMLLALNDMYNHPLRTEDLHQLTLELGADVPFFLYGRPALARGIGEILDPIENWKKYWYVTVTPPLQVSTAWVYGQLNLELTSNTDEYIFNSFKTESI
ncbi:MAG: 4-(cytidine 5'-diphospho)-2-C-methyl-D-erythritol kinase, partial [Desulfobacterales bacterium]|nr:4-(cytidine 5'-diphospho)-2-C-methyl-D-erythritol kinase [Desulfobacterales bacterium]